ncbi:MAG TPA: ureidoglycolate lyase [Rhodocyclaceae bacterium]|nr:ureidoglycolate lyase [Rhodocyclaceae bacterium]
MTTPAATPHETARTLHPEPLTPDAFAPFGDVIAAASAARHFTINAGNTVRYHDLATIDAGDNGRVIVSIFRGQPRELPFTVAMMERHPLASQAFVPLSGRPYLIVVAPAGTAPTAAELRLFVARADQGVNYAPGVWHHPLLALEAVSDFLVIDRAGEGANCDEAVLAAPAVIPALQACQSGFPA